MSSQPGPAAILPPARRPSGVTAAGAAVLAMLWVVTLAGAAVAQRRQPQRRPGQGRDMSQFTMLRAEGFPLNVDPEIIPAAEAGLQPGDMVMGIVLDGQARAYPVNYMNGPFNEVVNDELAGQAIAPSW